MYPGSCANPVRLHFLAKALQSFRDHEHAGGIDAAVKPLQVFQPRQLRGLAILRLKPVVVLVDGDPGLRAVLDPVPGRAAPRTCAAVATVTPAGGEFPHNSHRANQAWPRYFLSHALIRLGGTDRSRPDQRECDAM
jgi:hypothetical protein